MATLRTFAGRLLLTLCALAAAARGVSAAVSDSDVKKRISELSAAILGEQNADGSWDRSGYPVGQTALSLLALTHADIPRNHKAIRRGARYVNANTDEKVYSEALVLCALERVDPVSYRKRMERALRFLIASQLRNGMWSYELNRQRTTGDNSNTQFAVLGLAAARRCGLRVPEATRNAVAQHFYRTQLRSSGGWSYGGNQFSMSAMTCAGVASLALMGWQLEAPDRECGKYKVNRTLTRGLRAVSGHLKGGGLTDHYDLYALERVGMFLDLKTIGGIDWYRYGAETMLGDEMPGWLSDKCFELLFLAKGFAPIAIAKWQWNGDWNNDHDDVKRWVQYTGKELERKLDWMPARLDEPESPAAKASMIFVNGHGTFSLNAKEIVFLRKYLDSGGTLVGEACCNSAKFATSFMAEIEGKLFPERGVRFQKIRKSHPVTHSVFPLDPRTIAALELKGRTCRRGRVLFLSRDISCALNGEERAKHDLPRARKVAVNILAWTLGVRDATRKLDTPTLSQMDPLAVEEGMDVRKVIAGEKYRQPFGRLKHRGDWSCDPGFFPTLQGMMAGHENLPVFDAEIHVHPLSEDIFHAAVLFITGHEAPNLKDDERVNLKKYLQNGGFLMASACCSSPDFDAGFRLLMRQVLPNDKLVRIPAKDTLWRGAFECANKAAVGTKAYQREHGNGWAPLFGIRREGRWIVVYSPTDYCCALDGDLEEGTVGYRKESAFPLAANMIRYAFGQ